MRSQQTQLRTYLVGQSEAVILYAKQSELTATTHKKSVADILSDVLFFNPAVKKILNVDLSENQVDDMLNMQTDLFKLRNNLNDSNSTLNSNFGANDVEDKYYSLFDILMDPKILGEEKKKMADILTTDGHVYDLADSAKTVELSMQTLMFNSRECWVLTVRDISKIK